MVILQVINFDSATATFIRVEPKWHNLVKRINGRFLQEPSEDTDISTLCDLLGGDGLFKVSPKLGVVVDSPIGCTHFYIFYYD